jgi:hypothetical protein
MVRGERTKREVRCELTEEQCLIKDDVIEMI